MSLYPIIPLDPTTAALGNNVLPPGTLTVIPLDMTVTQMMQIILVQLSYTQDFSMRTWVSVYDDGIPIQNSYPIMRSNWLPFIIYIATQTPPDNTNPILVTPGSYYLNILNLTNEQNIYSFTPSILA